MPETRKDFVSLMGNESQIGIATPMRFIPPPEIPQANVLCLSEIHVGSQSEPPSEMYFEGYTGSRIIVYIEKLGTEIYLSPDAARELAALLVTRANNADERDKNPDRPHNAIKH
jgi:hypothetical protein